MGKTSITEIDKNFQNKEIAGQNLELRPIPSGPMVLEGFHWYEREGVFCRLPQESLARISPGVETLAWHTAGGAVRFRTDSPTIAVSATLDDSIDMPHMARAGSAGFDLYFGTGGDRRFVKNASSTHAGNRVESVFVSGQPRRMRDCTIYFPLYRGVKSAELGLEPGCELQAPAPLTIESPLVFYGSSITQGGCASRPGNAYTAAVARRLDANHINLGFSGNARGETHMAELIASLPAAALIYDYDHNAPTLEHLRQTHEPFFRLIRAAQPNLPVVMVSRPDFYPYVTENCTRREIIRATYDAARDAGDRNVHFVDGQSLFGDTDRDACTVDGCHPNDLGFYRMAQAIAPAVRKALNI